MRPRWRQTVAALLFLWVNQCGGEGGHTVWATVCPPYHAAQAYICPHHHLHTHINITPPRPIFSTPPPTHSHLNLERILRLRPSFGVDRTRETTVTGYKPSLNWRRVQRQGLLLTVREIFVSHWTATARLKLGSP